MSRGRRSTLAALSAVLLSARVVAAPTVRTADRRIDRTTFRSDEPGDLVVESHELDDGEGGVGGVTVVINNVGDALTGEVRVELRTRNGALVTESVESAVFDADERQTVTVTFDDTHARTSFAHVRVTVGESL